MIDKRNQKLAEAERERLEEEKVNKRLEEERKKIQAEFEEEERKKKAKLEEVRSFFFILNFFEFGKNIENVY